MPDNVAFPFSPRAGALGVGRGKSVAFSTANEHAIFPDTHRSKRNNPFFFTRDKKYLAFCVSKNMRRCQIVAVKNGPFFATTFGCKHGVVFANFHKKLAYLALI